MYVNGSILASMPSLPACYLLIQFILEHNPIQVIAAWLRLFIQHHLKIESSFSEDDSLDSLVGKFTSSQLLAYLFIAVLGFWTTDYLIPVIKVRSGLRGR